VYEVEGTFSQITGFRAARVCGATQPAVGDAKSNQTVGLVRAELHGCMLHYQQVVPSFIQIIGVLCSMFRFARETGNSLN